MEQNTVKQLKLHTDPESPLTFTVDRDQIVPITFTGCKNGNIIVQGNEIIYTPNQGFVGIEKILFIYENQNEERVTEAVIRVGYSFKARSHILSLLGDELIGSDNLAIFELVKNSYDADAEEVTITFKNLNTPDQRIIVEDDGDGMTFDVLKNVWLEIGTDFKRGERRSPSKKFKRISLGEKGVGRLAVHKLGRKITLETQKEGELNSSKLELNWQKLIEENEFLNETSVSIIKIKDSLLPKAKGTRITISNLKKQNWSRAELRDLARKVLSIKSPFKEVKGSFNVIINAEEYQEWIEDIKNIDTLLNDSVYYFDFELKKNNSIEFAALSWNYKFSPPKSFEIESRQIVHPDKSTVDALFNVFNIRSDKNDSLFAEEQKHLQNSDLEGIGDITGRFYVYNLSSVILTSFGQSQVIKRFVRDNCGVKIFRDGIRVYNYGEPGDDWLGLDLSRVQRLGSHFSKNVTIGSIEITQQGSFQGLKEKTNREGFDENYTFLKFKNICGQIFRFFEATAQKDRDKLRDYLDNLKPVKSVGLPETINQLAEKLKEKNFYNEISPLIRRVEKDYNDMRDVMLNSGMTGINLGIVFHEVDREVRFISADLKNEVNIENIKQRVKNLVQLLENFSPILRQNISVNTTARQLVEKAKQINNARFLYHNIIFSSPLLTQESEDFQIFGPGNLMISALSNIIDNAIYWVTNKKELLKENFKPAIFIGSDLKNFSGPAIIIADNGYGFNLDPEDLIMPYRTRRPGGMGLGLYFVNLVMEMIGGKLIFPEKNDTDVPKSFTGAMLVLVFPVKSLS